MAASRKKAGKGPALNVSFKEGQTEAEGLAAVALDPVAHGMAVARLFNVGSFGEQDLTATFLLLKEQAEAAGQGDFRHQRMMLATQATTLNLIFSELARRAAANMGEYIKATETYMRLALKAQAQSRATVEALDKLANGHVQTVKHVHVSEGGQAVIADQFHHHTGGPENGQSIEQPHATGTGAAGASPALPCPDPLGPAVPIPGSEGQAPMPNARRQGKRGT